MADPDEDLPDATPDRDYDTLAETPARADAADRPKVPSTLPPPGACDCEVALPAPGHDSDAWADALRTRLATLQIDRAILVRRSGALEVPPDGYASLEGLKAETRLVLPAPATFDDAIRARLREGAVAGLHLAAPDADLIARIGAEAAELGLLLEIGGDDLEALAPAIRECPAEVVLSGLGRLTGSPGDAPFATRLALVADGHAAIKLCGPAVTDAASDPFVAALAEARAEGCLWATEISEADPGLCLDAFFRAVTDTTLRQTILVDAPARIYGLPP